MEKTDWHLQEVNDALDQAHGRVKTVMELTELIGKTVYFVIVETKWESGKYAPSSKAEIFSSRVDCFMMTNSGGGWKRVVPRQHIDNLYAVEIGDNCQGVNTKVYNVGSRSSTQTHYCWNAAFASIDDANRYIMWIKMAHDCSGRPSFRWYPSGTLIGKKVIDRRLVLTKKFTTK